MNNQKKNVAIISLHNNISEIIELANSLGYTVLQEFIQHRKIPDVNFHIGSGKVDEIKEYIDDVSKDIHLIIVDGELKPSQWFALEKKLQVDVYDRIRLILAIFEERAERKEARLQVKLAQLQYERPFVRELIHRARAGEHPGLMAGGEYQVDDYYEMIKKQIKKIRGDLKKIRSDRELHRQTRQKSGFYLVSLAGYTNAGKSSLLNLLSKEKVKVEGRLFSTLSTTTRRIQNKIQRVKVPILLTDTVGFIENLPSWIVDAFHSTLEEIEVADVVVLILDGSEEKEIVEKKLEVSLNELQDLGVTATIVVVLNKIDLVGIEEADNLIHYLKQQDLLNNKLCIPISVKDEKNIDVLLENIYKSLPHMVKMTLKLPLNEKSQAFVSGLYKKTGVSHIEYNHHITVDIECNAKIRDKIQSKCEALQGSIV
ncbi:MAG: GTPase HflX [Thermoplasmatales archaeon]|nr:MAG: GTPase HflX [Thermoplasmatales archaeon]